MRKLPPHLRLPVLTAAMIGCAASLAAVGTIPNTVGVLCMLVMAIVPTNRKWWEGSLVPLPLRIVFAAILIYLLWVHSQRAFFLVLFGEIYLEQFLAIRRTNSYAGPGGSSTSPPVSA
jgi:hypothetical protein